MNGSAPALAASVTRAWAGLYTRGLPVDVRAARLAELESDLWEHEQWRSSQGRRPGRIAFEITRRLAVGVAADLSWRREHRAAGRRTQRLNGGGTMLELLKKHGMVALAVALGVWSITVVPLFVGSGDPVQGAVSISLGLLILGGLIAMQRGARGGRLAVASGAIGNGLLAVWLIVPPIAAVAIVLWLFATRDASQAPPQPA